MQGLFTRNGFVFLDTKHEGTEIISVVF